MQYISLFKMKSVAFYEYDLRFGPSAGRVLLDVKTGTCTVVRFVDVRFSLIAEGNSLLTFWQQRESLFEPGHHTEMIILLSNCQICVIRWGISVSFNHISNFIFYESI